MKKLFSMLLACTLFTALFAQQSTKTTKSKRERKKDKINALIKQEEEGVSAYKKQIAYGIKLNTDGYGIFVEKGYSKSVNKTTVYEMEINVRKHNKEEKQSNQQSTSPYIYGKINFFYPVKLGIKMQYLLGNKTSKNGVSVSGIVGGGITLGLLRAYEIEVPKNNVPTYIGYNSPDSLLFINADTTASASGPRFGTGWNHLKLTPGIYLKPAIRFDYGRYNEIISAIEVGLNAEFYAKKIPQMIYQKEKQFFFGAYVALAFGRRK